MAFWKSCMLHFHLVLILLASLRLTEAQISSLAIFCNNTATFAPNSTYQRNRDMLLSSLISNATIPKGFIYMTVGQSPDVVYGLFLCRGDVTTSLCQTCVEYASMDIKQLCPVEKASIKYLVECLLRYSDNNIFSVVAKEPDYQISSVMNLSEPARLMDLLGKTIREATSKATRIRNGNMFGTKKANFTRSQNLYTLAQCTPDLSVRDCSSCLDYAVSQLPICCYNRPGGRVLMPSCNLRYELYSFYNESNFPADTPENQPLSSVSPGGVSSGTIIAILVPIGVVLMLVFVMSCFLRRRVNKKYESFLHDNVSVNNDMAIVESLEFNLATVENATDKFSDANKLGVGGFGEVYKGTLPNGDQIAVKRLSKNSGQGEQEFKNEVVLVAKLQHRNLVRMLGFCCQGEEKILVYEYVPNRSLDYMLFDPDRENLDWSRRYNIVAGIARGILYLHEDSRLKIIHRDLKASNILLDSNLNPKISDFGMARIFGVDQTEGNTNRVVGTFGYMSPEYVMQGQFSVKSDVYSFGVLVLEIVTGKKSGRFYQPGEAHGLLNYVWKHWRDGTPLEILDSTLKYSYSEDEVMRCIHIGLLCVQEDPAQRPTMATIVHTMNSHSTMSSPQQPAFVFSKIIPKVSDSNYSTNPSLCSVNDISVTEIYPR